jgi:hypothetical protein
MQEMMGKKRKKIEADNDADEGQGNTVSPETTEHIQI